MEKLYLSRDRTNFDFSPCVEDANRTICFRRSLSMPANRNTRTDFADSARVSTTNCLSANVRETRGAGRIIVRLVVAAVNLDAFTFNDLTVRP